jgi:hypothetical protein
MQYTYRCRRECLLQSPKHNLNRPFRPGNRLVVDFDLSKEIPSIAPFFQLVDQVEPPTKAERLAVETDVEKEKELKKLKRNELFVMAEEKGHIPNDDMTKQDIIDLIIGRKKGPVIDAMGANKEPPPAPHVETIEAPEGTPE